MVHRSKRNKTSLNDLLIQRELQQLTVGGSIAPSNASNAPNPVTIVPVSTGVKLPKKKKVPLLDTKRLLTR